MGGITYPYKVTLPFIKKPSNFDEITLNLNEEEGKRIFKDLLSSTSILLLEDFDNKNFFKKFFNIKEQNYGHINLSELYNKKYYFHELSQKKSQEQKIFFTFKISTYEEDKKIKRCFSTFYENSQLISNSMQIIDRNAPIRSEAEEVASGGVLFTDGVCEYHHYKYRGHVGEVDDIFYGKILIGTTPLLGLKTPGRVKWLGRPTGWDNDDVYRRLLGFDKDTLKKLRKQRVI